MWDGEVLLVPSGAEATYTYEVTNTGNTPLDLGPGVLDDRCSPVHFLSGDQYRGQWRANTWQRTWVLKPKA